MAKSTKSAAPLKPYKAFPLTPHRATNRWCKKLKPPGSDRTKTYYFGPLSDWKAAKAKFDRDWPYIVQGLTPPVETDDAEGVCTMRTLCNRFLESKRNKIAAGELTELSYRDYYRTCALMVDHFGADRRVDSLRPLDFEPF